MNNKVFERISEYIDNNDVVLFMKGSKDMPMCGFSAKVVHILEMLGVDFLVVDVLEDSEIRDAIKKFSDWPTIPQLYIRGEFIGGCDIVSQMYSEGELQKLLQV
jgi:monothiol glutaredoxin